MVFLIEGAEKFLVDLFLSILPALAVVEDEKVLLIYNK